MEEDRVNMVLGTAAVCGSGYVTDYTTTQLQEIRCLTSQLTFKCENLRWVRLNLNTMIEYVSTEACKDIRR